MTIQIEQIAQFLDHRDWRYDLPTTWLKYQRPGVLKTLGVSPQFVYEPSSVQQS